MLNGELFTQIQQAQRQILLVTKYWDKETTHTLLEEAQNNFGKCVYGVGENRIESIIKKGIPREHMHFIGNIQSRKIPEIIKYCSHIHSLSNLKHAQKIGNQNLEVSAFLQIRLDADKNIGIKEDELEEFLKACRKFQNLKIIGLSGMGAGEVSKNIKKKEFQKLVNLRNQYIPNGLISAGTSRDYDIALNEGVDIVRVGKKILA